MLSKRELCGVRTAWNPTQLQQEQFCWRAGEGVEGNLSQPQTSACFLPATDSPLYQLRGCVAAEEDWWQPAQTKPASFSSTQGPKRRSR